MPNWKDAELTVSKVRVLTTDAKGRIASAEVPGTSETYRTRLVRQSETIWTRCVRNDGKDCLGNQESVCYHCLATILAGINQAQVKVEWFDRWDEAQQARQGGRVIFIRSSQSPKTVYAVLRQEANHEVTVNVG